VISSLVKVVLNRNDGVIGRYVLIGIVSSLNPRAAFTRVRPAINTGPIILLLIPNG
jgi:hypothetical protein